MSRFLPKTLILRSALSSASRRLSTLPETAPVVELSLAEAKLVERIEDAIHSNIVKKSKPDWLEFVPGASYWVPPRRSSYGVAEIVNNWTNPISDEQCLAATTPQGYPSSDFFFSNDFELGLDESEDDALVEEMLENMPVDEIETDDETSSPETSVEGEKTE